MKTIETKKHYVTPTLETIHLDHDISLILESGPTGEPWLSATHFEPNDPLKTESV
jgi:hypothetical protein